MVTRARKPSVEQLLAAEAEAVELFNGIRLQDEAGSQRRIRHGPEGHGVEIEGQIHELGLMVVGEDVRIAI